MAEKPHEKENVDAHVTFTHHHLMNTKQTPPVITVHQAAKALQVQPSTVYAWVREDELPHLRLGGRIRIPAAKLADLLGITVEDLTAAVR